MAFPEDSRESEKEEDKKKAALTRLLELVGDDAAHEVRVGAVQVLHQLVQRLLLEEHQQHVSTLYYSSTQRGNTEWD